MPSKKGDGALKHCDPGLSANPRHLLHLLVFGAESIYGNLHCVCFKNCQKVPPHMRCMCYQKLPEGLSPYRCHWGFHASGLPGKAVPPFGFAAAALSSELSGYICLFVFVFSVSFCLGLCLFIQSLCPFVIGCGSASAFLSSELTGQIICPGRSCPSESFAASPQVEPR